jgi:Ser/Thr protein kinase RdoA (MazF antagonist)
LLQASYAIGEVRSCTTLRHDINDTYEVVTTSGRYVLRVSPGKLSGGSSWRPREGVLFELEVLRHLDRKGVAVATPLRRNDGSYVSIVEAPEGERQLVLFHFAAGEPVTAPRQTEQSARRYGQAVAALHSATEDFTCGYSGRTLDLDVLLEQSLTIVRPFLVHRPEDRRYLDDLATVVRESITALASSGLETGVCHGDAQGGNACVTPDGTITFFDFEWCGTAWRAYDLAVFFWGAALGRIRLGWEKQISDGLCNAYLSGYEAERPLGPAEHQAIAPCVLLREFWYLGIEAGLWHTWGTGKGGADAFFEREMAFIRQWSSDHQLV